MSNRSGRYLSVSFKKEDIQVLAQLERLIASDGLPISETIVDAIRLKFGHEDLALTRSVILEKYADKELIGPRLFKTFEDILEWELQNTELPRAIADKWGISRQVMACICYLYFARPDA